MTDFTVHTLDSAPEDSRSQLASVAKTWGFVPKLQAVLAESPVALIAYDTLFGLVAKSTLTPAEQQVAFLTITVFNECEYCTMGHTYLARAARLAEGEIQALRNGDDPSDLRLSALSTFARQVAEARGRVGDAAVDAFLGAGFTRANVLDVVMIVATKTISTYTNHIAHTPKEDFMADPSLAWTAPSHRKAAA